MKKPRYIYPEALRATCEDLPSTPGVYLFHGHDEATPLYIGKSVNIRQRVFSHFRNRRESKLLHQTRRISHIRTAGEIGALLLEAQLIKQRQPLHNQRLRRNLRLCALQLLQGQPQIVFAQTVDFSRTEALYGLFYSRAAALAFLAELADSAQLCLGVLGLERLRKNHPCFRSLINRCRGACHGNETEAAHEERLRGALESHALRCWPWEGAVVLVERGEDRAAFHVIKDWCHLGSYDSLIEAHAARWVQTSFDADCYRILCGPLLSGGHEIIQLAGHSVAGSISSGP